MSDLPKSTSSPPPALGNTTASSPPTTTTTSPTDTGKSSNPFDAVVVPRPGEGMPSDDPPSVNASTKPISPPAEQIIETPVANPSAGNAPINPAVAELKAIFPDYDEIILQSVLESAGNQAAAIEILLGMSDPSYKSEAAPPQTGMSQTELDEQLARRLMIEEQEAQSTRYVQYAQGQNPQRRNSRYGQVQPTSPTAQGGSAPGDKDAMSEIQEQFTKAAEVGKKTFGNIFTKVKAKIQEFERGSSGGQAPSSQWMGGYGQGYQQNANYPQYHPQQGGMQPQQQASYYDPNSPITATPVQSQTSPPRATSPPATQGYDAAPNPSAPRTDTPTLSPSPPTTALAASSSLAAASPAAAPIDGGKLGLLPKRPVSLVRDTPSQQAKRDDSDDDLEYAENPFDDRKKL